MRLLFVLCDEFHAPDIGNFFFVDEMGGPQFPGLAVREGGLLSARFIQGLTLVHSLRDLVGCAV